jgi:hypothetical protein
MYGGTKPARQWCARDSWLRRSTWNSVGTPREHESRTRRLDEARTTSRPRDGEPEAGWNTRSRHGPRSYDCRITSRTTERHMKTHIAMLKEMGVSRGRRRAVPAPSRRGAAETRHRRFTAAAGALLRSGTKGEFRLGNGRYYYPLTITDFATRYLLTPAQVRSLIDHAAAVRVRGLRTCLQRLRPAAGDPDGQRRALRLAARPLRPQQARGLVAAVSPNNSSVSEFH